jgi:hemerythrin
MLHLDWYKSYSINNEELDNHHKTLFDIFNRIYAICMGEDEVNSFAAAIDELVSYSDYHFKAEEKYMREIGYKDIGEQITEHLYFRQRLSELKQMSNGPDFKTCHDIIIFLGNWLMHHVMEVDKKLVDWS